MKVHPSVTLILGTNSNYETTETAFFSLNNQLMVWFLLFQTLNIQFLVFKVGKAG